VQSTLRPFLRLALSTPRPVGVAMRARKPDVRVARRRVPRLVQPRHVLELATTTRAPRPGAEPGRRASGAREAPGGGVEGRGRPARRRGGRGLARAPGTPIAQPARALRPPGRRAGPHWGARRRRRAARTPAAGRRERARRVRGPPTLPPPSQPPTSKRGAQPGQGRARRGQRAQRRGARRGQARRAAGAGRQQGAGRQGGAAQQDRHPGRRPEAGSGEKEGAASGAHTGADCSAGRRAALVGRAPRATTRLPRHAQPLNLAPETPPRCASPPSSPPWPCSPPRRAPRRAPTKG